MTVFICRKKAEKRFVKWLKKCRQYGAIILRQDVYMCVCDLSFKDFSLYWFFEFTELFSLQYKYYYNIKTFKICEQI